MSKTKTHAARNKNTDTKGFQALCATRSDSNGKVLRNSRSTYQFMASKIVLLNDFRNVASEDRCAHCVEAYLELRNRQRAAKGQAPVSHAFEVVAE